MDYKKTKAFNSTVTRDVNSFSEGENIYELIAILGKRADQIGLVLKEELNAKLEEFASPSDNLEEIFENREQIEISKFYEKLPKPTLIASQEWSDKQIYYRNPDTENDAAE
jgi:DNA-directed RNA polymerase subunit K/omega